MVLFTVLAETAEARTYRRFTYKVFYSFIDRNMAIVAPNDNGTLGMHYTYDMTFVEMTSANFTIRLNETVIAVKSPADKIMLLTFYTNSSELNINVIKTGDNSTIYLSIHYFAEGGIVPIPPTTPPEVTEPEPIPAPQIWSFTNIMQTGGLTLLGIGLGVGWLALMIKYRLEHYETEKYARLGRPYYTPKGDDDR
jgi:hypothetical protein